MNSNVFGPCSRFAIKPVYHQGQQLGWSLWDAEGSGEPVQIGKRCYRWSEEAFATASELVAPEHRERTATGQCWVPL